MSFTLLFKFLDSAVSIMTGYGMDDQEVKVRVSVRERFFSSPRPSVAHAAFSPVGTRGCSLGVKRLGREADHSPPTSVKVDKWIYASTPLYVFMA
jgi:hypothetical protein